MTDRINNDQDHLTKADGDYLRERLAEVAGMEAELKAARAEVERLTTARPFSEYDHEEGEVLWWRLHEEDHGKIMEGAHWLGCPGNSWVYDPEDEPYLWWLPICVKRQAAAEGAVKP
jgi:hypothetical protein